MLVKEETGIGVVETQYFTIAGGLSLENGEKLNPVTLAYETYGRLNEAKSNAVLVLHALTGDAHAAGYHAGEEKPGWWDNMIGPGKAFDTEKYFVICANVIGGCRGSTGPSSINPQTGKPYGLDFPLVTIRDMVAAQRYLIDFLGIDKLLAVAGGSMGGMQVLQWAVSYPERVRAAIPIGTAARHSPQQIAFNEVGRQAIIADPNWQDGNYYGGTPPTRGLAVARMVGHITYMSDVSMTEKFGRRARNQQKFFKFDNDFEVEGYLRSRGDNFVRRFDANSYLYITKAIDRFDLAEGNSLSEVLRNVRAKFLVIAFKSDWLYPSYQSQEIVRACKTAGVDATYCEICSSYGHDAFLLETEQQSRLVSHFLNRVAAGGGVNDE
ncbi:MAG: homoserine O-acetyltransferase [Dehalococcoidales bacterium]|nr:homoserine O-acetyltransferase [Dehalococcoidales bacterium]